MLCIWIRLWCWKRIWNLLCRLLYNSKCWDLNAWFWTKSKTRKPFKKGWDVWDYHSVTCSEATFVFSSRRSRHAAEQINDKPNINHNTRFFLDSLKDEPIEAAGQEGCALTKLPQMGNDFRDMTRYLLPLSSSLRPWRGTLSHHYKELYVFEREYSINVSKRKLWFIILIILYIHVRTGWMSVYY